jgi:hypothetical protein
MPLHIASFADLLREAREQKDSQRLLFVFVAAATAPSPAVPVPDPTSAQTGGLSPLLWLDKAALELASFDALRSEAARTVPGWDIVFVSSLSGKAGIGPSATLTAAALQRMVDHIKAGRLTGLVPFDHTGQPLFFA